MKRVIALIFILVCGALGAGIYLAYDAYIAVFPPLSSGVYVGALHVEGSEAKPFFIDSSAGPRDLVVAVGDAAMPAQRTRTFDDTGTAGLPLILTGSKTRLRMIGSEREPGVFEGTFLDPIRNERGKWRLKRVAVKEPSAAYNRELQTWAHAFQELQTVEQELTTHKRVGDARNPSASYADVSATDLSDLQPLREELAQNARRLELSGRLSDSGRLVHLSRETIDREARWIEQVLKLEAPETNPSFQGDLARAYRVKELLDQIAVERQALDRFAFQGDDEEAAGRGAPADGLRTDNEVDVEEPTVAEHEEGFYDDL